MLTMRGIKMKNKNNLGTQINVLIPEFVSKTITELDFEKLKSMKQGGFWIDQFKAFANLIPDVGGAIAQEVQNYQNYKAAEFFRKFTAYIYGLKPTSCEERLKFCDQIEEKARDYAGNVIMSMVDRLDNIHKQSILANLTNAEIMGYISMEDLFRLTSMLERIPYVDLLDLLKYKEPYYDENGNSESLFATGVLRFAFLDTVNSRNEFVLSPMGQKLVINGMRTPVIVQFDGLQIGLPTMTDEDLDQIFDELR